MEIQIEKDLCDFGDEYFLELDSQDIRATLEYCDIEEDLKDEITGVLVKLGDGDFEEVWVTTYNRPFYKNTRYFRVATY